MNENTIIALDSALGASPGASEDLRNILALLEVSAGTAFFASSTTGSSINNGRSKTAAKATIAQALALCTANKGDVIFLLPGHNEGFGNAQLTIDKAGVTIFALGSRADRARIDFDHANASIDITASGVTIDGVRLLPSVTAVLVGIDVNAAVTNTTLRNLESLPGEDGAGVDEFAKTIDIKAGCTATTIDKCLFTQHASAAGVLSCVCLTGASDMVSITNCNMWGAGAGLVAPINGLTTLSTRVLVENCILTADDEPGIELLTGTTGVFRNVDIFSNLATIAAATVADGVAHFRVRYVEVGNESDAVVKTASADD